MTRHLKSSFSLSLFFVSSLVCVQAIGQTPGNSKRVPIYKSKADSIQLIKVEQGMQEFFGKPMAAKAGKQTKLDSLMQLRMQLNKTAIVGYRIVYSPSRGFVTLDSLLRSKDPSKIVSLSIDKGETIPPQFWDCYNLESLEFVNTKLENIPDLSRLPKLKTVSIYNNRSRKRLTIETNPNITTLKIRVDDPQLLPKSYKNLVSLTNLDLSENKITRFPNGARHNKKLVELILQNNELTLKGRIKRHRYLSNLVLKGNTIEHVPPSIRKFKSLKKLSFNTNNIVSVSGKIEKLKMLEHLSFYKNKLARIPDGVYKLGNLKEIDLFYNEIETFQPEKSQWKNLNSLFLSHNKIMEIPESIVQLKSLEGLYAWDNRIDKLPESIGTMVDIKYIRINGNFLKVLPSSMINLTKLEELDISNNYITQLPPTIFNNQNLKIVALTNNPFDDSTRSFLTSKAAELRTREVMVHGLPGSD